MACTNGSGIAPGADPWLPERAVWPLLEVVDGALHEPWLRRLAAHLGGPDGTADPARRARRFGAVRHLAVEPQLTCQSAHPAPPRPSPGRSGRLHR